TAHDPSERAERLAHRRDTLRAGAALASEQLDAARHRLDQIPRWQPREHAQAAAEVERWQRETAAWAWRLANLDQTLTEARQAAADRDRWPSAARLARDQIEGIDTRLAA